MSQALRAIYTNGAIRLLDPVDLTDGQEIHVVILSEAERVTAALGDLLVAFPPAPPDDVDEASLLHEIEAGFAGQPPLSDTIIQERHEGL